MSANRPACARYGPYGTYLSPVKLSTGIDSCPRNWGWRDRGVSSAVTTSSETRARILATAVELIAEKGFAATTTRELSERLGFTKAALYYHFRTKDDLLVALV